MVRFVAARLHCLKGQGLVELLERLPKDNRSHAFRSANVSRSSRSPLFLAIAFLANQRRRMSVLLSSGAKERRELFLRYRMRSHQFVVRETGRTTSVIPHAVVCVIPGGRGELLPLCLWSAMHVSPVVMMGYGCLISRSRDL